MAEEALPTTIRLLSSSWLPIRAQETARQAREQEVRLSVLTPRPESVAWGRRSVRASLLVNQDLVKLAHVQIVLVDSVMHGRPGNAGLDVPSISRFGHWMLVF